MRNWRQIIATAGAAALMITNLGVAPRTVRAAQLPPAEVTAGESAPTGSDASDTQTGAQSESEGAMSDGISLTGLTEETRESSQDGAAEAESHEGSKDTPVEADSDESAQTGSTGEASHSAAQNGTADGRSNETSAPQDGSRNGSIGENPGEDVQDSAAGEGSHEDSQGGSTEDNAAAGARSGSTENLHDGDAWDGTAAGEAQDKGAQGGTADEQTPDAGSQDGTIENNADEEPQNESTGENKDDASDVHLERQTLSGDADDGASVEIAGMLPEDATISMEPVTPDLDTLRSYLGASIVGGIDNIALYDISIYLDGKEWEPDDSVSVVIRNPVVRPLHSDTDDETVSVDPEELVAIHLQDGAADIATTRESADAQHDDAPDHPSEDADTRDDSASNDESEDVQDEEPSSHDDADAAEDVNTDTDIDVVPDADPDHGNTTDSANTDHDDDSDAGDADTNHDSNNDADTDSNDRTATILDTTVSGDTITFVTDSFSEYGFITYKVDYYYNDAEYHMTGGTTMHLSDLFRELGLGDTPMSDVSEVAFTDESLLRIERDGEDWNLISLLPFDSEEELAVTLTSGETIRIRTTDSHQYPKYSVDNADMIPFAGEIKNDEGNNYIGRYNIFGGGNGIAATLTPETGYDGGTWGYNGNDSADRLYNLKNNRVDAYGQTSYDSKNSNYVSTSVGSITWDGSLEKAYFSFGYLANFGSSSRKLIVTLTGPKGNTRTITIYPKNQKDWNDTRDDQYVSDGLDWSYLTFDATSFVEQEGEGLYTVSVTASGAGSWGSDDRLGDMGWTLYGVSYNPDQDYNVIIAGSIGERRIEKGSSATATFSPAITPSGSGKVWYNVQGGEKASGATDRDHLLIDKQGGGQIYLGDGTNGSVKVTTNGSTWDTDDIARPNEYQTVPDGSDYVKFSNRFSFAMGEFDTMSSVPISGIEKSIDGGDDVFGSIMLMARISSTGGNPLITKRLSIPYPDDVDTLKESIEGDYLPFRFQIEPLSVTETSADLIVPMPDGYDEAEYNTSRRYLYTVNIPKSRIADGFSLPITPDFASRFLDMSQKGTRTYRYKVTEVNDGAEDWTYDANTYYLEFTVEPYDTSTAVHTVTFKWTDEDGNELEKNDDGNYVSAGIYTNTYETAHIVDTGVRVAADGIPALTMAGAIAMLAAAYMALARYLRPRVRR